MSQYQNLCAFGKFVRRVGVITKFGYVEAPP